MEIKVRRDNISDEEGDLIEISTQYGPFDEVRRRGREELCGHAFSVRRLSRTQVGMVVNRLTSAHE